MKFTFILIVIFGIVLWSGNFKLMGQSDSTFCRTNSKFSEPITNSNSTNFSTIAPITMRIFAHFIRRNDGTGGISPSEFATIINNLENVFSPHSICLSLEGTANILSTNLYGQAPASDVTWATVQSMGGITLSTRAINIFFFPNDETSFAGVFDPDPGAGGNAGAIISTVITIGGMYDLPGVDPQFEDIEINLTNVVAHELGHCFGLLHTHDATYGYELVNNSNCSSAGDLICDTPADPMIQGEVISGDCNWAYYGSNYDENWMLYNPDTENIMSYSTPACLHHFSPLQGQRMRSTIIGSSVLAPIIVPNIVKIEAHLNTNVSELFAAPSAIIAGFEVDNSNASSGFVKFIGAGKNELRGQRYINILSGTEFNPSTGGFSLLDITTFCHVLTEVNEAKTESPNGGNYISMFNQGEWIRSDLGFEGWINTKFTHTDTIINNVLHQIIREHYIELPGFELGNVPSVGEGDPAAYSGRIFREDTLLRLVYGVSPSGEEMLLYDYSLLPGDTLFISADGYLILIEKNPYLLENGMVSNEFIFINNGGMEVRWIEGIGNLRHPFIPGSGYDGHPQNPIRILCAKKGGINIYSNLETMFSSLDCENMTSSIDSEDDIGGLEIFPNPVGELLRIEYKHESLSEEYIRIYNISGSEMVWKYIGDNLIDISAISPGVYFLTLTVGDMIYRKSFIKQL